jgi:hypothetical protein
MAPSWSFCPFRPPSTWEQLGYTLDCSAYPDGDGRAGLTMDRAGQIAATAWVRLVANEAIARGVEVVRLRPPLGEVADGRDFSQTRNLIKSGYEYAIATLYKAGRGTGLEAYVGQ